MSTGHAQEVQSMATEGSCTPLPTASDTLVDEISELCPTATIECHICMDYPTDPVATSCGHVFCWSCMYPWLRNGPRPCPVCRKLLSRHLNILSLHGPGAAAEPSNGNGSGGEAAASATGNAIPPRPRNPLLFCPRQASMRGASDESDISPESMAVCRAISDLLQERSRGRVMMMERANLKRRRDDLLQRNAVLEREANRMDQHIARLQQQLAQANQLLRSERNDGV